MASRSLDDLDSVFRVDVDELLSQCASIGVPLRVTFTLRTQAEQDMAVAQGRSKTRHGMHLPHPPEGKSLAVDVCPEVLLDKPNYSPDSPLWWRIGSIGMALGMRWGGAWDGKVAPVAMPWKHVLWDPGHFEMRVSKTVT